MIKGPLEADGRLAAKNATKIRAALAQVTNFKSVFDRYQETHPEATDNKAQDRSRARAWLLLNVGFNNDALHNAIMHSWAEAYVLGQDAAGQWIAQAEKAQKALNDGMINWDNWKPGDRATALLVKPVGGFQRYLEQSGGASYFKKFDKETVEMLGTALADSIDAGLDSEAAALLMKDHVASPGRALTIAITEQNRAMSFSTIQRYKEAELQKMEWHTSDPCDKCAMNAGQVIEIGGQFNSGNNQPPAHPHCRCVLLPVIPGMEEDGGIGGTTTAPTVTSDGTIEHKPFVLGASSGETWKPIDADRWIARQEANRLKQGLDPATEYQLKIMRDQANDAKFMFEKGPNVILVDKKVQTVTEEHVQAFMKNFDIAYEKIPEWRKFDEEGNPRGYALVVNKQSPGVGTLAYTYIGHDAIWFSPKDVISSLAPLKDFKGWFMPAADTNNENLYTIAHELGHTVDSHINETKRGKVRAALTRKYKTLFSGYSRKNTKETYAEVYAQWVLGESNPLTEGYAKAFGWDLSAKDYYEQMPSSEQWRPAWRPTGTL